MTTTSPEADSRRPGTGARRSLPPSATVPLRPRPRRRSRRGPLAWLPWVLLTALLALLALVLLLGRLAGAGEGDAPTGHAAAQPGAGTEHLQHESASRATPVRLGT